MNSEKTLSPATVLIMAIAAGIGVANLNYIQPIESVIAQSYHVSNGTVGAVAMLTQLGYAFGLLLIVPLGDLLKREHLIRRMLLLSIIALLGAYLAPSIQTFAIASTLIGITSVAPQIIIPYAAYLTPALKRGRVLGEILSGLLVGILLSRTFSGVLASYLNWHMVYLIAAGLIFCLWVLLSLTLPTDERPRPATKYQQIIGSLPRLFKADHLIQAAAINGFVLFGVSTVFWSTLAFYLSSSVYHLGSREAGLLGLLGITGVIAAPIIGRVVDRYQPRLIIGAGLLCSALAYVIFAALGQNLFGLILGIIILDLGTQLGQVANQARIQAINPEASNRYNSLFMFAYFLGGAMGSLFGTLAWEHWQWLGVCGVAAIMLLIGLIAHFWVYQHADQEIINEA